jgi:hypothetical protein
MSIGDLPMRRIREWGPALRAMSIGDHPMRRIREWEPTPAPEEPTQTAQGAKASSFAPRGQPAPALAAHSCCHQKSNGNMLREGRLGLAGGFRRAGRGRLAAYELLYSFYLKCR